MELRWVGLSRRSSLASMRLSDRGPQVSRCQWHRLDDYLQVRPELHTVCNPILPGEDFVRHWDDDKYANFHEVIHRYRGWIDEAYEEHEEAQSIAKWRRVFGDEFARGAKMELAETAKALVPISINP